MRTEPQRIDALTGFRACAAFLVFFHHFTPDLEGTITGPLGELAREGHMGVTLFFVLSGFLITYNYSARFRPDFGWYTRYLRNRFARIFPLYFLLTVVTLWYQGVADPVVWVTNLTLVRGYFRNIVFSGIGPGWSLTVEETFYLTAPLLFAFKPRTWWLPTICIYSVGLLLFALTATIPVENSYGFISDFHFVWVYTFLGRAMEFIVGAHLAWHLTGANKSAVFASLQRLPKTWIGIAAIPLFLGLFALVKSPVDGFGNFGVHVPLGMFLNNCVLPWFVALLIWGLATEKTSVSRLLGTRLFVMLGKTSYALYLIHYGITLRLIPVQWNFWKGLAVMVPLSIALYYLVEAPLHKLLRGHERPDPQSDKAASLVLPKVS